MEFTEPIHAKVIRALVGPNIHDIFLNIVCLIFYWSCFLFVDTWDCFTLVIELTLFRIFALSLLSKYALHLLIFEISWISMSLCTMPLLDCLNIRWIIWLSLIKKMHIVYHISTLTLMFYDSSSETVQVHILIFLSDCDLISFLSC